MNKRRFDVGYADLTSNQPRERRYPITPATTTNQNSRPHYPTEINSL